MAIQTLQAKLEKYKGKHIKDICDCGFVSDQNNHCAHFVSHIMGYSFGYKCSDMTRNGKGVNIRVHEVFKKCITVGEWPNKPNGDCLAFVTAASNVNLNSKTILNVPAKHIGIFTNKIIYHYSNRIHKVISETPENFGKHYSGQNIRVYYGTFPIV